jgi:multidrug efflux pump subunit AcrA (membrane-fusion protein)
MHSETNFASAAKVSPSLEGSAEPQAWRVLGQTEDFAEYARAWVSIVGRSADGLALALVLLGPAEQGPFEPVAQFPDKADGAGFLQRAQSALRAAAERRRPVVESHGEAASVIGFPLLFSGRLHGVVLAEGKSSETNLTRRLMRHLQWSAYSLEAFVGRTAHREGVAATERAQFLIGVVDATAAQSKGNDAARTLANSLAHRFECENVVVGRFRRHRSKLVAASQAALIDRRHSLSRAFEAAQDESIDQGAPLDAPSTDRSHDLATAAHERLSRALEGAQVLTVPMFARETAVGAITLARPSARPFASRDIDLIDGVGAAIGALLEDKWRADRSLPALAFDRGAAFLGFLVGPRRLGLKAAVVAAIAGIAYLALATDEYRVRAHAQIEGETRRMVSAPFDGFIHAQFARAGDVVAADAPLAQLDVNEIELDRLRQIAKKRQSELELDKALGKRDLAEINIARAQIEESEAEINLSEQMIARGTLRAPFAAVVVSGDLSQSVGRPVSRGDVLFELAPLDHYRMNAVAPEADIGFLKPGQTGELLLSALPGRTFPFTTLSITSVAQASDGVNGFEVIAPIDGAGALRPGMEGVAKIDAGRRSVGWIWLHPIVDWLRVKLWSLIP